MKYELYVDGGCRGNGKENVPAGIGVILLSEGEKIFELSEQCHFVPNTNNKAELFAAIKGLEQIFTIKNNNLIKDELIIYTDSAYTLNGITNWINNWKKNNWKTTKNTDVLNSTLWKELDRLYCYFQTFFNIQWKKVKGHNGNKYNEEVDRLANLAMDQWKEQY